MKKENKSRRGEIKRERERERERARQNGNDKKMTNERRKGKPLICMANNAAALRNHTRALSKTVIGN